MIRVGNIDLWTESFGDPSEPTVLLIQGPASGLVWPDELCDGLAAGRRHVIRYDHRDTGRSSTIDFATLPYTLSDLAADAVGVLDAYGVRIAHVVGFSGGGMAAQVVALEHRDRVASLTSWSSTPLAVSFVAGDPAGGALPGPDPDVVQVIVEAGQATDDAARVESTVAVLRAYAGTLEFDEAEARARVGRVVTHTRDHAAFANHWLAWAASPDRTEVLADLTVPALVIHGTADRIVPPVHGEATAQAIPGAKLLMVDGMGHDFPRPALDRIVPAILEHTALVGAGEAGA